MVKSSESSPREEKTMSKMKAFIEDVSYRHGFGGDINTEVLRLAGEELSNLKPQATFEQFTIRADGRVELVCQHGCGHVSVKLTKQYRKDGHWNIHDGIHGCCGCCGSESFSEAEKQFSDDIGKEGG